MNFQPQLSQEDLAQMIDREGLLFECRNLLVPGNWREPQIPNATKHIHSYIEIRLAPGALSEFGLKPGMQPHNPDGLTADQITEGGKYRSVTLEELDGRHGIYSGTGVAEHWTDGKWWKGAFANTGKGTHRVPVSTPFPKADTFQQELDSAFDILPILDLEKMLDEAASPSLKFKRGDRVTKVSGGSWTGLVVGTYSTELTPEGYAVESENEPGSVQIYPAKALKLVVQPNLTTGPCPTCGHGYEGIVLPEAQIDLTTGEIIESPTPEQSSAVQSDAPDRCPECGHTKGHAILCKTGIERAIGKPYVSSNTRIKQLERELTAALSQRDEARRLLGEAKEALTLATNRIHRLSLECEHGSSIRSNAPEWATECLKTNQQITEYLK